MAKAKTPPKAKAEKTVKEQPQVNRAAHLAAHQFQPGQSGNPNGRPKGSRNKFGEQFIDDFMADWMEHGKAAIETVRKERPQDYLKAAVQILPKQVDVRVSEYAELSDDELDKRIRQLASLLEIGIGGSDGGDEAPPRPQQTRPI